MLFQLYIGRIVDGVGYAPVFWAVSGMHLLSAAFVAVMIPRIALTEHPNLTPEEHVNGGIRLLCRSPERA